MSDAIDQGITVTEMAPMDLPIDANTETTAAFVGRALRGPLNTPVLITNFASFQRRFGGVWHHSTLGPSIQQFFEHGGARVYIVRVASSARGAMLALPSSGGVLVLHAAEPGSTENIRAAVDYDGIDDANDDQFNLVVQRVAPGSGLVLDQEIFSRISCDESSNLFVGSVLLGSSLVRAQLPLPPGRPLLTYGGSSGFESGYVGHAQRGSDGIALSDYDLIGSDSRATGLFALNNVEHFDLLYLPPTERCRDIGPAAVLAAEQYCRRRGAMLVMDPLLSWDTVETAVDGLRSSGYASSNIIGYFPRMALRQESEVTPRAAGAAITALLCKLDRMHGPWEDLDQVGLGLHRNLIPLLDLGAEDAHMLVREGLNVIAGKAAGRAVVCGSVTLGRGSQMDRKSSSLTVRRLCLAITNAIGRATRWAVFEPDSDYVSERILGQVDGYMSGLANSGAFADKRFMVQCEIETTKSTTDQDRGITIMLAFRPFGTEEDIALTIHQMVSGCRVAATAFAPVAAEVA